MSVKEKLSQLDLQLNALAKQLQTAGEKYQAVSHALAQSKTENKQLAVAKNDAVKRVRRVLKQLKESV